MTATREKTEAERRFEAFCALRTNDPSEEYARTLFRAIFDPLPEPEPVKSPVQSLGEQLYFGAHAILGHACLPWSRVSKSTRERWEDLANATAGAHEARRPKPTLDVMAKAMFDGTREGHELPWEQISQTRQEFWIRMARAVFPLFGVEP